ncbi:hypothetical protein D3C87_1280720 [compost metagenome]
MNQAQEILFVVILQVRVVVLQGQVLGDLPVSTGVAELVAVLSTASHGQASAVAGGATSCVLQLTYVEGHVVDFLRGDGATFKGLRQHTAVVRNQNRHVRHQSTAHVGLCLREARLDVASQTTPLIGRRAIGIARAECVGSGVMALAAVEMDTDQRLGVDTETYDTLGEARLVIELQTLSGLTLAVARDLGAFTVIGVEIIGTRTNGCLAVFDETGGACLLRQHPYGHGQSQGGLVHGEAPLVSNSCSPGSGSSAWNPKMRD